MAMPEPTPLSKPPATCDTDEQAEKALIQLIHDRAPADRLRDAILASNRVARQ